jgi:hypothetical protein
MENPVSAGLQLLGCFSGGRVDNVFSGSFDKVFAGVCSEVAAFFVSGAISPFPAGDVDDDDVEGVKSCPRAGCGRSTSPGSMTPIR